MRRPVSVSKIAWAALFGLFLTVSAQSAGLLETMDSEVSALYERNRDAIIRVHTQRQTAFPNAPSLRVGTGFFLDGEGRLLTSAMVVEAAEQCWIDWRGRKIPARVLGFDPLTNLAVLQVQPDQCVGTTEKLPFVTLGDSDQLKTGSLIIAMGYPYDQPSAPVVGFVQGFDIKCGSRTFITSHIRTDCRLQPGQGGGPVFNTRGEVIGMAVAAHMENQSYVLPIKAAKKVFEDIVKHGAPQYGWVGLSVTERRFVSLSGALGEWEVFVEQVSSNTPAAKAGFQAQDVLIRIGTNEIHRAADILNTMFHRRCGDRVNMTVVRMGTTQEVVLVIGQRPPEETELATRPTLPPVLPAAPRLNVVPAATPPSR